MNQPSPLRTLALVAAAGLFAACAQGDDMPPADETAGMGADEAARQAEDPAMDRTTVNPRIGVPAGAPVWTALLAPVNDHLFDGVPDGSAMVAVTGDSLIVEVGIDQIPPGMTHLQHIHGYVDGSRAGCPAPNADDNGDGVIDLLETGDASGTTLIPLHGDPASLEIPSESYPTSDGVGRYVYRQAVGLDTLTAALRATHGIEDLALDRRVVYVHGVPADTELPETAASLEGVPAHVTLPIACGVLRLKE